MLVSRELSSLHESSSLQNSANKKYITEASYIEFSGVKVHIMCKIHRIHFNYLLSFLSLISCPPGNYTNRECIG